MHADDEERPVSLTRTDCQHHMIWIASWDECQKEAAQHTNEEGMRSLPSHSSFYKLGECRVVSSVGHRSSTLFVQPPLKTLPMHGTVTNGDVVFTVVLSDMHEFAFLDHAMQRLFVAFPSCRRSYNPWHVCL